MPDRRSVLFVHVPQERQGLSFINLIPAGTFALAELASRRGFPTTMLHTLVERMVDPEFDLPGFVEQRDPAVLCLPLHWHYQAWEVMRTIRQVKSRCPEVPVVLGGYTASLFAEEILRDHPEVDYVVRGEADGPLITLLEHIDRGAGDLGSIPNLVWRGPRGVVRSNELTWVADQASLDSLDYARLSLLRNFQVYVRLPELGLDPGARYSLLDRARFLVSTGRGCPVQCFYCGGGAGAQKLITGRRGYRFRKPERVLEEIRSLVQSGVEELVFDYDPEPRGAYYSELFRRLGHQDLGLSCVFASWSLPSPRLMDAVYEAGFRRFELVLSPDFGNERIRKCNKGWFHTNREYMDLLASIDRRNRSDAPRIEVVLYLFVGAPNESRETLRDTVAFADRLRRFPCVKALIAQAPQLEPGSPLSRVASGNGRRMTRASFAEYLEFSRRVGLLGGELDGEALMGFSPDELSFDEISHCLDRIGVEQRQEAARPPRGRLQALEDRLVRSPDYELETWRQVLRHGQTLRHFTLRRRGTTSEVGLSHLGALVYRLADGQRTVDELLGEVQDLSAPVEPGAAGRAFFQIVGDLVSQGALWIEEAER